MNERRKKAKACPPQAGKKEKRLDIGYATPKTNS
jgi:hypothetical protein